MNRSAIDQLIFAENQEVIEFFKSSKKLSHFIPENLVKNLLPITNRIIVKPGEDILTQGQLNHKIFVLMSGDLGIYASDERIAQLQQKGDLIGEMSVISEKPCSATVRAETEAELLSINIKNLDHLDEDRMDVVQHTLFRIFTKVLSEKLALTNEKAIQFEIVNRELVQAQEDLKNLVDKLEIMVEDRTKAIRTILDNVQSGILISDPQGLIQEGHTKSCKDIFQKEKLIGVNIADAMQMSSKDKEHFMVMYDQAFLGILPAEISLAQIPEQFVIGDKTYRITGSGLENEQAELQFVMFTIVDISMQEAIQKENERNERLIEILRNREFFLRFVKDAKALLDNCKREVGNPDDSALRMDLHTVKGNAGCFSLDEMGSLVHKIEEKAEVTLEDIHEIENELSSFLTENFEMLKIELDSLNQPEISIDADQLSSLINECETQNDLSKLKQSISQFAKEAYFHEANVYLAGLPNLVERTAGVLSKQVALCMTGTTTKVDGKLLGPILNNISHLIRNSIDHGIELPSQRGDKARAGTIKVDVSRSEKGWSVLFADDGAGMDPLKIGEKAVEKGLLSADELSSLPDDEKLNLIFDPKFSIRDEASMTSGRGVGMSSVKKSVEQVGGTIALKSELGQGSQIDIFIPIT